jgi:hypothetical protein
MKSICNMMKLARIVATPTMLTSFNPLLSPSAVVFVYP